MTGKDGTLGSTSPTRSPGVTPRAASATATRPAESANSSYVTRASPIRRAGRPPSLIAVSSRCCAMLVMTDLSRAVRTAGASLRGSGGDSAGCLVGVVPREDGVEDGVLGLLDRGVGEVDGVLGVRLGVLGVGLRTVRGVLRLARVDPLAGPGQVLVPGALDVVGLRVGAIAGACRIGAELVRRLLRAVTCFRDRLLQLVARLRLRGGGALLGLLGPDRETCEIVGDGHGFLLRKRCADRTLGESVAAAIGPAARNVAETMCGAARRRVLGAMQRV